MTWRQNVGDWCADVLRLIARAGLLVAGIILSAFLVWFVWRGCWRLGDVLNGWLFS